MIINKIKKNREAFKQGITDYLPHPKDMGSFSKIFPGRLRGDVTGVTGGLSSAKTSLTKHLIFRTIEWSIKENKNYKVLWFGLEESEEQFEYSLLSWLVYRNSSGRIRYNIEHFEGLGKSIKDEDIPYIELVEQDFMAFRERVQFYDMVANSFGIYKEVRDYAREHGTFFDKGKALTEEDIANKRKWDAYEAKNPKDFVEVVVDHIGILVPQTDEKSVSEAMGNLVKTLRMLVAKKMKYSVVIVHQQALEMENLEHVKEKQVYASVQGLGDNKLIGRDYLNLIGITNLNRYGLKTTNVEAGEYNISGLGDYQRVIGILKRRYGKANKRFLMFFDGCTGVFKEIEKEHLDKYGQLAKKYDKEYDEG